jgi:hypothetical protein
MGRPPIKKSGPMTATEHQRRWRRTIAREKKLENPKLREKQGRRAEREAKRRQDQSPSEAPLRRDLCRSEWRFEPWSRWTGMDRAADNHFSTSFLSISRRGRSRLSPPRIAFSFCGRPFPCLSPRMR